MLLLDDWEDRIFDSEKCFEGVSEWLSTFEIHQWRHPAFGGIRQRLVGDDDRDRHDDEGQHARAQVVGQPEVRRRAAFRKDESRDDVDGGDDDDEERQDARLSDDVVQSRRRAPDLPDSPLCHRLHHQEGHHDQEVEAVADLALQKPWKSKTLEIEKYNLS